MNVFGIVKSLLVAIGAAPADAGRESARPTPDKPEAMYREAEILELRAWVTRVNRCTPRPADLPKPTIAAHYVTKMERLEAHDRALSAGGYVPWRKQSPPIGEWIETTRRGDLDNSEVWRVDSWTPGRFADLWWRPTPEPVRDDVDPAL